MSEPQVTSVTTRGENVVVEYGDGHKATFEPYRHGWGYQVEGLQHFLLYCGDRRVLQLNSRLYRAGPGKDEHCIVFLDPSYTQQQVAAYWDAAKKWLNENYLEKSSHASEDPPEIKDLWYPWVVVSAGWLDLDALCEGRGKILA